MKFMFVWKTSIYTGKNQVKVEVGGSHVKEIGGRTSGVALVKYRSKSTLERHLFFLSVFWPTSSYTCEIRVKIEVGGSNVGNALCF